MATIYLLILGAIASKVVGELYDGVKPVTIIKQKLNRVTKTKKVDVIVPQEVVTFRKCGNGYTMKLWSES